MEDELIFKCNTKLYKWTFSILLLIGNIILTALGECDSLGEKIFVIAFAVGADLLSVLVFVLLSFFPRIDESGYRCRNKKGEYTECLSWEDVLDIRYEYSCGIFPEGMILIYKEFEHEKQVIISISPKQAKMVYNAIHRVKEIVDRTAGRSFI